MRFGCCANLDDIQAVQDAGYDYIELPAALVKAESPDSEFEETLALVRSYEIVPEVWNSLLLEDMKVTGPEVDTYRIERYMRTAFHRIEELGGEIVVFNSPDARNIPEGFSDDEARQQIIEFVTLAGRISGTHGITVAIQPISSAECNMVNTLADALQIVHDAHHPFVKLTADLYQMNQENEGLDQIIRARAEIVHVHTSDYSQPDFLEVLKEIGYNERISVNCRESGSGSEALHHLRRLYSEIFY
ncbi:sugar phosphate isomerase/epimerase [bacterium]|nr:sugar phosphate isomerase/epimerase [bacterium]